MFRILIALFIPLLMLVSCGDDDSGKSPVQSEFGESSSGEVDSSSSDKVTEPAEGESSSSSKKIALSSSTPRSDKKSSSSSSKEKSLPVPAKWRQVAVKRVLRRPRLLVKTINRLAAALRTLNLEKGRLRRRAVLLALLLKIQAAAQRTLDR